MSVTEIVIVPLLALAASVRPMSALGYAALFLVCLLAGYCVGRGS